MKCKCCQKESDLRFGVCFDCADIESVITEGVTMFDKPIVKIDGSEKCYCCLEIINVTPLPIGCKLENLYYLGPGVFCQYFFCKMMAFFLFIIIIVPGVYNLDLNFALKNESICDESLFNIWLFKYTI
jgi:hypothetical protein